MSHYITVSVPAPRALAPHMPETAVLEVDVGGGYYLSQCGPGPGVSPRKNLQIPAFWCTSARKLTPAKVQNTTRFHSRLHYVHPAWGNIKKWDNWRERGARRWDIATKNGTGGSHSINAQQLMCFCL